MRTSATAPGLKSIDLETLERDRRDRLGVPVELAIKDALKARIEKRIPVATVPVQPATPPSTSMTG